MRNRIMDSDMTKTISILREPGLTACGVPEGFTTAWLGEALGDSCRIQWLSADGLSALDPTATDLLILPYGDAFPAKAWKALCRFVTWGGNVMTTGGAGFGRMMEERNGGWVPVGGNDPCQNALGELGFKYYQPDVAPSRCIADTAFLPELPDEWLGADTGPCVTVNTGDGRHYSHPPAGNVFPERYPVREGIPLVSGTDRFGRVLKHGVHLVKDWQGGGRWVIVCMTGEAHALDPRRKDAAALLRRLVGLACHPLTLHRLETDLPCYRDGETVRISGRVRNRGGRDLSAVLCLALKREGHVLKEWRLDLRVGASACECVSVEWPVPGTGDDFRVQARLEEGGATVDRADTGFLRWNPGLAARGRLMEPGNGYFRGADGATELIHGMNYYESRVGELMWLRPDPAKIDADLAQMRDLGIRMLRPHYHHSKWFRDYSRRHLANRPLPFDDYFSVCANDPQPGARDWRVFDMFVQLCHKHGIVFHPDLFTLVPDEMGDPRGWIGKDCNDAVTSDPARMAEQDRFIAALAARYHDWPGVFWDLWNEPDANHPRMRDWVSERVAAFRAAGDRHPILLGSFIERLDMPRSIAASSMHGDSSLVIRGLMPYFSHEVWNSHGCSADQEECQRRKMIRLQHGCYGGGACGFQPWGWTRQARLRIDMWGGERWDDELGVGTRDDGVVKPSGRAMADGIRLFDRLGLVDPDREEVLVAYPRRDWDMLFNIVQAFAGLLQNPLVVDHADLVEGLDKNPRLVCLIDPPAEVPASLRERLLEHVRAGGALYQSGGAPLLAEPPAASEPTLALGGKAVAVSAWEWAFAGDIPPERIATEVRLGDLFDPEITVWNPCQPGEAWGLTRDSFNAGLRPGAHYLLRATVDLPGPCGALGMELPLGVLYVRGPCGEQGMPGTNLWIYADGRLVGSAYGWGESYVLPCSLPAGRHEILLVVLDLRGHGGVLGTFAFGKAAEGVASASWHLGLGLYVHAPIRPESRDRRLLPPLYRQLLTAAGVEPPDADPHDSELFRRPTSRGTAWIVAREPNLGPAETRIGPWRMTCAQGGLLHLVEGRPVLVEAITFSDRDGAVVAGEGGTALVYSEDGQPIERSARLMVKLREGVGRIVLRHTGRLLGARLVDGEGRSLEPAKASQAGDRISVELDHEAVNYWCELEFALREKIGKGKLVGQTAKYFHEREEAVRGL